MLPEVLASFKLSLLRPFLCQRLGQPRQHASSPQRPLLGVSGRRRAGCLSGSTVARHVPGLWPILVASRFNGAHPRCRPAVRAAAAGAPALHPGLPPPAPDLAEVFQARVPVMRHVPKAARSAWAQCLARALAEAAAHNTIAAWRDLLMLPKAVLRPPPRGGAKRRDQTAQHTLRRCRRWLEGEREELWEAQSRLPRRRRSDEDAAGLTAHQERCKALAAEGELSRACSALVSPPLLGEDEEVSAKLRAKHPQCPPARPGMVPLGPPALKCLTCRSTKCSLLLAAFDVAAPPAPPGCVATTFGRPLAPLTVTRLLPTSLLRSGSWQPALLRLSLRPTLGGPPSMPFPKGMTMSALLLWGNACAVLLVSAFVKPSKRRPSPLSGPYSSELQSRSAVRLLCTLFASGPTAMRATQPRLSSKLIFATLSTPWTVLLCFGSSGCACPACPRGPSGPTIAIAACFSDSYISSEAGVQQGDPLGPLLFALALHPALEAARSGLAPPDLVLAFLGDVCLAGDYRHVAASLARLTAAARQVGLELNPEKCEVVACAGADHCIDMRLFPAEVKTNASGAFSLLGAPIGPPAFCEAYTIKERVEKARPLLAELASLPDPQTALLLLRHCAAFCRIAYASRVTPPGQHITALHAFDAHRSGLGPGHALHLS